MPADLRADPDREEVYSIIRFAIANGCVARMSGAPFQQPPFKPSVAGARDKVMGGKISHLEHDDTIV
jgi:hypothetical protein